MWSRIQMKRVIIIPNNGLYRKREWTQMTLVCYGCNKLQQKHIKLVSRMTQYPQMISQFAECLQELDWGRITEEKYMLKRIISFFSRWRDQT